MKTILWVNNRASFSGGAERYIHDTAGLMAQHGFTNLLLAGIDTPWDHEFTTPFEKVFPLETASMTATVAALKPDIIYVHNVPDITTIAAVAAADVPSVRFFHDHSPFCPRDHKYYPLTHQTCTKPMGFHCWRCLGVVKTGTGITGLGISTAAIKERYLKANRALTGFISGSRYMADLIVNHGFPAAATRSIPLFLVPGRDAPRPLRNVSNLIFAGTLIRGKGLDVLIKSLAYLDPYITLTVAGDGPQKGLFVEFAKAAGVEKRVDFKGRVAPDVLADMIAGSAAMVIPSREPETFCLTGLSAFAARTPVVASGVGGMTEWLKHGQTGLIYSPPQDPAALAASVKTLLRDPALAAKLTENGYRAVAERFTPAAHVEGLCAFFELMQKRHAGTRGAQ